MLFQGHRPHAINTRLWLTAACYAATLNYFTGYIVLVSGVTLIYTFCDVIAIRIAYVISYVICTLI